MTDAHNVKLTLEIDGSVTTLHVPRAVLPDLKTERIFAGDSRHDIELSNLVVHPLPRPLSTVITLVIEALPDLHGLQYTVACGVEA